MGCTPSSMAAHSSRMKPREEWGTRDLVGRLRRVTVLLY
jgi:hypothetical protein